MANTKASTPQYYNSGYGNAGGTANNGAAISSVSVTLPSCSYTKTGHTFNKWAAGSASGTQYAAGATYTSTPAVDSDLPITMYAIWSPNTYHINYYVGNATSTAGATLIGTSDAVYGQSATLTSWAN